jgi:hypothetical protein
MRTTLGASQVKIARKHARAIDDLPPNPFVTAALNTEYPQADLPHHLKQLFHRRGLLQRVDKVSPDGSSYVCLWTVSADIREVAAEHVAHHCSPCGCGHSGIRNLGDGEYTCTTDSCDVRVSREVVDQYD